MITERDVAAWKLTEPEWRTIVVDPYRDRYADYARSFDRAAPALHAAPRTLTATRRHYADDAALTRGQAWTRWALPVLAESYVAEPALDAVFVRVGNAWRAIAGLERAIEEAIAHFEPACAQTVAADSTLACREIAWAVADAALRNDAKRVARACTLAATRCGKRSTP